MKRPASRTVMSLLLLLILIFDFIDQIALINEHVVLYKNSHDLTICLIGRSEDSNELLIYTAVETIYETLSEIIK